MANNKNNMDNFLRESLGDLTANPSQSVWKGITKRLIILELLRLNFTNIGKAWLYSGLATVATISGIAYFSLSQQSEENTPIIETTQTEETINNAHHIETDETVLFDDKNEQAPEILTIKPAQNDLEVSENTESLIDDINTSKIEEPKTQKSISNTINSIQKKEIQLINDRSNDLPKHLNSLTKTPVLVLEINSELPGIGRAQMKPITQLAEEKKDTKTKNKNKDLYWTLGASYNPEWPLSDEEMFVNNHQFALNAGLEYKKWAVNIGFGVKTEKTPSMHSSHFYSYDSVGYFYDIDYYEINPENPDSITIFYSVENLYDSISHESSSHGPDQKRRWSFIPVSIGYQIYESPKYQMYANIFGQYGWQTYVEESDMDFQLSDGMTITNITPDSKSNYLQIGVGIENNFNVFPNWWIYAEPRINYYINTPYSINQTTGNGPYSLGLRFGVKYNIKRR